MFHKKTALGLVVAGLVTMFAAGAAPAQDQGGGAGGGRGGRGGNFDPAAMRQHMQDRLKEALGVTDEEWKVLQPKIDKVQTLAMQARFGGMRLGGRRGGDNADQQPTSDLEAKSQALRTALDNKDSKPEEIAQKLAALRAARESAKQELTKAQAALRELVTPKQEAVLVINGLLD